ncbi:hypothetical protein B0T25DRAFT_127390 [Lasiosphaeria hispida]|uniref:Uncharacterized protein n=1 Tax=Lasiosphaeria hispida TaxID=260671 RepID=A0AAJ0MIS1_9PEZI|nr:hypothetical protein B0T25DRAFT_127390 [Lasiosphaeria hispida]
MPSSSEDSSDHSSAHSSDHSSGQSSASESGPPRRNTSPSRRRQANVYDAVAGRVARRYFKGINRSTQSWAPEDVLFRRKNAAARYAESDIYWANENLPDGGQRKLPQSDLLRCVHSYSSNFYEAMAGRLGTKGTVGSRIVDERSMDETALLAFGVLLEEASREVLGKRGDLVLTEGKRGLGAAAMVKKEESRVSAASPSQRESGRKTKRRKLDG